jgi:thioredoxin 1
MNSSFENIINSDKPVLVDFFATWCGPCKTMSPILEDLKKRLGEDIKIIKIDVDKAQSLAQELRISGVPTLILYKNGQQVWRQSGVVPVHQLEYTVKQFA